MTLSLLADSRMTSRTLSGDRLGFKPRWIAATPDERDIHVEDMTLIIYASILVEDSWIGGGTGQVHVHVLVCPMNHFGQCQRLYRLAPPTPTRDS